VTEGPRYDAIVPRYDAIVPRYDAIVIGSGVGGLTAASILATLGRKRVLVLEQHMVAGGFTHEFKRPGDLRWDVGVHYVGELHPGATGRAVFDYVSQGRLRWSRMAEPFERFVYPDFTFEVHGDEKRYRADLIAQFPDERAAIEQYFRDLKRVAAWGLRRFMAGTLPGPLAAPMRWLASRSSALPLSTTQDHLDRTFRDPRLKALLVSQWRDYGLTPDRSAFLIHAVIASHYLTGGYYPVGGASAIARAIVPVVESAGGQVLIRRDVKRILIDGGRAVGVEAIHRKGGRDRLERYHAPLVISNAGAWNTYAHLLPRELAAPAVERMESLGPAPTATSLYLSFRESPEKLGFRGENYWISEDYEHDAVRESEDAMSGRPSGCYLSFPSLKDPEATAHTAEILVLPAYDAFKRWADRPWKRRGEEYEAQKARMAAGMLDLVDRHFPGFSDLVDYSELSTPLSVEHFTAHPRGAIYGLPGTPERFRQSWLGVRTPVKNVLLAGADVYLHGVLGAAMGGVAAAGAGLGALGFPRAMSAIMASRGRWSS
jgi:phytoene dehydrogenase-like protein